MLLLRDLHHQSRAPPRPGGAIFMGGGDVPGPTTRGLSVEPRAPTRSRPRARKKHDALSLVRLSGQVQNVVASAPLGDDLVPRLNRLVRHEGVKVLTLRFAHRALTRRFSVDRLSRADARRATKSVRRLEHGAVEVFLWRRRRVLGSLVVATEGLTRTREAVIEALAEGVAAAAHEILLLGAQAATADARAETEARAQLIQAAWAAGKDRVRSLRATTRDHRDAAGFIPTLPATELLDALDAIEFQMEWASLAGELVPVGRRTLQSSLRRLTRWLDGATDMRVLTEVRGRPRLVPADAARALYVAAFECLVVAWDLQSCTRVRVELDFSDHIALAVLDDGIGRRPWGRLTEALHGVLDPVGATFDIRHRRRGSVVRVTLSSS